MFGLAFGLTLGGGRAGGGTPPPPEPSTVDYSYAEVGQSMTGMLDPTGLVGKVRLYAALGTNAGGFWAARITGTDAAILLYQNTNGQPAGMVEVSVDGGAWGAAAVSGGKYVLFGGLEHAAHTVQVRINQSYGATANMPTSGTVLTVTGAPPSVEMFGDWVQPGDGNAKTVHSNGLKANLPGGSFIPANVIASENGVLQNIPSLAVRGAYSALAVLNRGRYIYVSVDGAAPTAYDHGSDNDWTKVIDGLSGLHTYYVWGSGRSNLRQMAVGGVAPSGLVDIASKRRLDQYGDSITHGVAATSPGATDTFRVAAAMGFVGGNFGVSGNTIAQLLARMSAILAARTVTSDDVAVIAIGRNDVTSAWTSQQIADYTAIVQACVDAGYGKIICRGILPEGASIWPSQNGSITSIVSGFADPRVVFCDTSNWSGIATSDGTHPTDAGYVTLAGYAQPAYEALIG